MMRKLLKLALAVVALFAFHLQSSAQCGPQNIPVSQDFSSWPLSCWNDSLGTDKVTDGGGYAKFNYWNWSTAKTGILRSDTIVITSDARVKFKWSKKLYSATSADALTLRVRNVNQTSWDTLWHKSGANFESLDGATNTAPGTFASEILTLNTSFTGDSVEFEFYGYSGYGSDAWVDDFLVEAIPACAEPLSLDANTITSSAATLTWASSGTAFNIEYDTTGYTFGSGTTVTATSTSKVISGLNPNTCYDYYVQNDCSPSNGTSTWSGPFTFCTLCATYNAPYTDNLDAGGWVKDDNGNATNSIVDPCWSWNPDPSTTPSWRVRSVATGSSNTGPSADNTSGTGNYAYLETSGGSAGDYGDLTSPLIDLSALTVPQLEFYFHMYGADMGKLIVQVSYNSGAWVSIDSIVGQQQTASSDAFSKRLNILDSSKSTVQVRFRGVRGTDYTGDLAIDDVKIIEAPACPEPTSLFVGNITSSTADVTWNSLGGAFNIEYGSAGFVQGTGTVQTSTTNSYSISGLASNSCYDVYVQNNCAPNNGVSLWAGPFTFCTKCSAISTPIFEDFTTTPVGSSSNPSAPDCWSYKETGSHPGYAYTYQYSTPYSAPNHWYMYNSSAASSDVQVLISPKVDSITTNNVQAKFYAKGSGASVVVGTMSNADDITTFHAIDTISLTASYAEYTVLIDVSNGYNNTDEYVAFAHGNAGTYQSVYVDDILIEQIPQCYPSGNFGVTALNATTATITWTRGGATTHEMEYGPTGFTQGTGSTITGITDSSQVLTGLTPNYCYDVYLKDSCASGYSPWAGPFTFCTPCLAQTMPYTQDFDLWPLSCWDVELGPEPWEEYTATTGAHAYADFWGNNAPDFMWMRSPLVSVTQEAQVKFEWSRNSSSSYTDTLLVLAYNTVDPTPDTLFHKWGNDLSTTGGQNTSPGNFKPELFYLDSAKFTGKDVYVEFIGLSDYGPNLYVDNFAIEAKPVCADPQNLTATNIQGYQATASWSAVNGTQFVIEYGPQGFTQATGGGTFDTTQTTSINITGLTPTTCYDYYVMADCGAGGSSMWVGPYTFCTTVSCPAPSNVLDSAKTTSSAYIKWTTAGATNWNISWGPAGTSAGAGTLVNVTNGISKIQLTGLTDCTPYSVWVRDSCGAGDVSLWTGPYTFTTEALTQNLPFVESFNNGLGCWTVIDGGTTNDTWVGSTGYGFSNSTLDGTPFGFVDSDGAGSGNLLVEELISPAIDASGTLNLPLTLEFDQYYNNGGSDSAWVDVFDGTNWVNVLAQGSDAGTWATPDHQSINISAYANANLKVRFRYDDDNVWAWYWAVDNVVIDDLPSCLKPTALNATNITTTSADLSWTTGGATNWNVEYGPAGFTPGAGTYVYNASNPYSLTGLSPNTCYEYYVQDSCGTGDVSQWAGPYNLCTSCATYQLPWSDDVDGGSWIADNGSSANNSEVDQCWSRNPVTSYSWRVTYGTTTSSSTGPSTDASGSGNYVYTEASNGVAGDTAGLTSPVLDLTGTVQPTLSFKYHFYGSDIDRMLVEGFDGTSWSVLDSIVGSQQTSSADAWKGSSVDLTNFAGATNFQFRVRSVRGSSYAGDMALDEFAVADSAAGGCIAPSNLTMSNIACDTATLSWTSDAGTILTFVRFDTTGFDPALGGTLLLNPSSPTTLSGLLPGTSYDVWVADSCASGISATKVTFTTAVAPMPIIAVSNSQTHTTLTDATVKFDASGSTNGDTYAWDFGNGNTATGDTVSWNYTLNGTYQVDLTVSNGCGSVDSTITIDVQGIDVVSNELSSSLKVYPNPNNGLFRIDFETAGSVDVEMNVVNAAGQLIYTNNLGSSEGKISTEVDLTGKAKGMYIVQVKVDGVTTYRKITIQ